MLRMMRVYFLYLSSFLFLASSCKESYETALDYSDEQNRKTLLEIGDTDQMPRKINAGDTRWSLVPIRDWVSGFWPGMLWYNYEYTHDEEIKKQAVRFTELLAPLANSSNDHDLGFQIYCSYGNAYRLTGEQKFRDVLLRSAEQLAKLYNPKVGTILSWPWMVKKMNWPHNTIIDNMMNLELLFWASKNGGGKKYYDMALSHARVTMKNHFREDGSCYHVAVYDTLDGHFIKGLTFQGYSNSSMWARGQAWAIYGYTLVYRETQDEEFLRFAEKVAAVYLRRLPEDGIPFWDFDVPDIPNAPKDASAAAIVASALLELSTLEKNADKAKTYKQAAVKMLESLSSNKYQSGNLNSSLLLHSTGHYPEHSEIDASIIYADYYYMEALIRLKKWD